MVKKEPPNGNGNGNGERPVHERISRLEGHYESLATRIGGVESKMDKVIDILSQQRAKQLPPIQTILTTAAISMGIISTLLGGFFWLVDARVGSAVANSDKFVSQMTDRGGIWVTLSRTENRIDALEKEVNSAIKWRPVLSTNEVSPTAPGSTR
jgi:hypothetical protein